MTTLTKHRSTQQTYIMKELMEIFQSLSLKSEGVTILEKHNLLRILSRAAVTAESHSLVILQQIAQNILTNYYG